VQNVLAILNCLGVTITDMFKDADEVFFLRYYTTKHTFFTCAYPSVQKHSA